MSIGEIVQGLQRDLNDCHEKLVQMTREGNDWHDTCGREGRARRVSDSQRDTALAVVEALAWEARMMDEKYRRLCVEMDKEWARSEVKLTEAEDEREHLRDLRLDEQAAHEETRLKLARETLRDEFAKAALSGLLAEPGPPMPESWFKDAAKMSYRFADAMLAERSAKETT